MQVNAARDRLEPGAVDHEKVPAGGAGSGVRGRLTEGWRGGKSEVEGMDVLDQSGSDSPLPYNFVTIDDLPGGWASANLDKVAACRLGKMLDQIKNHGTLTPYIRNVNVRWFEFDLSDIKEIKIEDFERDTYSLRRGDLLICEGGEPGRCAIWNGIENSYIFQKDYS